MQFRSFDNPNDFKLEKLDDRTYKVTMTLTWLQLSLLVWQKRVEGMTHDESTAWLESHVPNFRDGLALVTVTEGDERFPVGTRLWVFVAYGPRFLTTSRVE